MAHVFARFAFLVAALLVVSPAHSQTPGGDGSRYTMSPADNGFVRLDRNTGAMAFCQRAEGRWTCTDMDAPGTAPDERQARREFEPEVSDELAELRRENRRLRDRIARLDERLASGEARPRPSTGPVPGLNLPSEAEVDRAIGYFGNILKKLKDQIEELKEQPDTNASPRSENTTPEQKRL